MRNVNIIQEISTCGIPVNLELPKEKVSIIDETTLRHIEKVFGLSERAFDKEEELYLYSGSNASSGYETKIMIDDFGELNVATTPPKGGMVMCAFFTDVIVFQK